jgi:hypothetical protein
LTRCLRARRLKLKVLRVKSRDHIARVHGIADIDDPVGDLAGDAETEIGLVARAHDAHELAARSFPLERDPLDLHGTLGFRDGEDRLVLAGGEQRQQDEGGERPQR